jgi:signal-transduction protein with cAMP-binding, CBS, and nucleotidyltransferase domain
MRVIDVIRKPPAVIGADYSITQAARRMNEAVVGALIVMNGERPVGIVTDRDLVVRALAHNLPAETRIDAVMTKDLVTIDAHADVAKAYAIFRSSNPVRRLPVMDGDRLVGLLSADDLLVDLAENLFDVARPITGQVLFGAPEGESAVARS